MPLLFSYGTLQHENVQLSTLGRRLNGQRDELPRFEPSSVTIDEYEAAFLYERVAARLASGEQAWVYVHAHGAPDGS